MSVVTHIIGKSFARRLRPSNSGRPEMMLSERSVLCLLVACAFVFLCQCGEGNDGSPWDHTLGTDSGDQTENESCERLWQPADGFKADANCEPDEFRYIDQTCLPTRPGDAGERSCRQVGNGRCYQRCDTDADCTNPERPYCSELGLFERGDALCNNSVKICRSVCRDDCSG